MPDLPRLSIITPCFNSVHTIRETLESVRSQDYANLEHVVIDGGSTDGTLDIVREFPHVRWISEKDEGHWHAMDKGIRMATGEAFAILNADDFYRPGALPAVGETLAAHPQWDGVFGDIVFVDGEGREIFRREEAGWDPFIVWCGFGIAHHQAFFLRKATYERLGSYRYKEFKGTCDIEYLYRLVRAQARIGHIPRLLVNFRYHERGQTVDSRIRENMARESALIRAEYGVPRGWRGQALMTFARLKRQLSKLLARGKCDLIPGHVLLRRHFRKKATFSSNIGLDKL
ncbi:MAG: glycosyltransferase family 2 protein [Chthoniobacteraceae bacterium]